MSDIEKDIKRCEELIKPEHANWIGISNQMAIAGVLARIKELEKENIQLEAIKDEAIKRYNFESIPKQKIKDKIEELDRKIRYEQNERALIHLYKQRKILTELLEKREETNE